MQGSVQNESVQVQLLVVDEEKNERDDYLTRCPYKLVTQLFFALRRARSSDFPGRSPRNDNVYHKIPVQSCTKWRPIDKICPTS